MAADIRALTGVRGIAAIVIVIYHFGKFRLYPDSMVWGVPGGYLVVDMFFMLSGYVMAYVYRETFEFRRLEKLPNVSRQAGGAAVSGLHRDWRAVRAEIALGLTGEETFARFDALDWLGTS